MGNFDTAHLKSKLRKTKPTEKSIAETTAFIIKFRKYHTKSIDTWLYCIRKAKAEDKLTILYVINHTLQESIRQKPGLAKLFSKRLENVICHLGCDKKLQSDETLIRKVKHVLQIWEDRNVLKPSKVEELRSIFEDKEKRKRILKKMKAGEKKRDMKAKESKERVRHKSEDGKVIPESYDGTPDEGDPELSDRDLYAQENVEQKKLKIPKSTPEKVKKGRHQWPKSRQFAPKPVKNQLGFINVPNYQNS